MFVSIYGNIYRESPVGSEACDRIPGVGEVTPLRSVWLETAAPAVSLPALSSDRRAEVAIVGAGYAGLNAALRLAELGRQAVVLDACEPGFGASGRNGGQVIAGLKYDPDELLAMYGEERGHRLVAFVGDAPAN